MYHFIKSSRGCQLLQFMFQILFLRVVFPLVSRIGITPKLVEYPDQYLVNIILLRHLPDLAVPCKFPIVSCEHISVCLDCDSYPVMVSASRSSCHPSGIFLWWRDAYS